MWVRTSVSHVRKTMAYKRSSAKDRLIRLSLKATRLRPTYCLTMEWGMDVLVDALAAGALDVVDITYSLSAERRRLQDMGQSERRHIYSRVSVRSPHEASPICEVAVRSITRSPVERQSAGHGGHPITRLVS